MKRNINTTDDEPKGKNGLTSRSTYFQRKKYKSVFRYTTKLNNQNQYIDLLNLKQNIFKIYNEQPINVSESVLKNLGQDVYAINFVADAFNELKELCKNSKEIKNEKFKNLNAKKAWKSLHEKYHNHMIFLFNEFIKFLDKNFKDKNINNFEDFILNYIKFLDNVIYKIPFLKSSYFLSKEYSLRDTGFIIDFDTSDADDDNKKYKNYLINNEYNEFLKLCKQTNFLIDKNCPWRLVYNIFSTKSEIYINNYSNSSGEVFNRNTFIESYFYKTKQFDLENLKNYMVILYNTFVDLKPISHNAKIIFYNEKETISTNFIQREKISIEQVNLKYNNTFWFNIYSHLFFVENKVDITQQQYLGILKNLNEILTINGLDVALEQLKIITNNATKSVTKGEYCFILPSSS